MRCTATAAPLVLGTVVRSGAEAVSPAGPGGLGAGVGIAGPALTVNRLCGSGLEAAASGGRLIQLGEAEVVLAGGTENMSQAPFVVRGVREGLPLGPGVLEDTLWAALTDSACGLGMAQTAENLAERYQISRAAQDEFAARSHARADRARAEGRFAEEIVPVEAPGGRGTPDRIVDDEHIRPET